MPFLGEIRAFTSELPHGWAPCEGQHLEIRKHQPLYALIGTSFGGDGQHTFALPDLRGRVTAGVDPTRDEKVGDTSGHTGEHDASIPYRVERWGIAMIGSFPSK